MNRSHITGKIAEHIAVFYLIFKGYRPLSLNDKTLGIESDIIAVKGDELVLIEVKWRQSSEKLHVAVHPDQKKRLQRKLQSLVKKYPDKQLSIQLVLICPTGPFIQHIKNPF